MSSGALRTREWRVSEIDERRASADEFICELGDLPTLPDVALRAQRMLNDPECSMAEVAELVGRDPVLAARIVAIANSSLYGSGSQPFRLTQAVMRLGSRETRRIVVTVAVMSTVPSLPEPLSLQTFWAMGLGAAVAARKLAEDLKHSDPEFAYLAGLMHAMGPALIAFKRPSEFGRAVELSRERGVELAESVGEVFSLDVATFTAQLLRSWDVPEPVCAAVEFRHRADDAPDDPLLAAILHAAARICRGLGLNPEAHGEGDEAWYAGMPAVLEDAIAALGFDDMDWYLLCQFQDMLEIEDIVRETFPD